MAQGESPPSDSTSDPSLSRNVSFSRLNAQAPEFVPTNRSGSTPTSGPTPAPGPAAPPVSVGQVHVYSPPSVPFHVPIQVVPPPPPHVVPVPVHHHHLPVQYHHHHQYHYSGFGDQEAAVQHKQQQQLGEQTQADHASSSSSKTHKLSDEATSKILNQVRVYFFYSLLLPFSS